MAGSTCPQADDVIIRREPSGIFTIGVSSGKPQVVCRTFEEALQRAGGFASQRQVRLWYTADGRRWAPLADLTLLRAIWNEYVEMPGLRLTREQAQRLWSANAETCASVLDSLVELQVLERSDDGKYGRLTRAAEPLPRLRMVRAGTGARRGLNRHMG